MFAGIVYPNHLKMTRFFFLLAALPYFAGSAAAHPAILPGFFRRGKAGYRRFRPDCLPARGRASPVPGGRRARFPGLGVPASLFRRGDVPRGGRGAPGRVVRRRQARGGRGAGSGQFDGRTMLGRSPACARLRTAVDSRTPGERCGAHETGNARQYPVGGAYGRGFARGGLSDGIPLEEDVAGELERMPLFQGGDLQSFRKWVMENLKYPREALEDEVEDDIVVTFIVEKDGRCPKSSWSRD